MSMMDFDLSKENIQPLRGGRNPTQLGIALQAQTNRELQLELEHQKEEFENAIINYEGDDPLENYYHYISWVEQSYPKHGHEGNLYPLLEHCLGKFENDPRYTNDRRFCKLWIKYIDLHKNPLELYHMMHSKGLCIGCSDLYRAWAYYHEAADDFQSANKVLDLGKRANAQPYDELETAYQNLLIAVGQYNLHGADAARRGLLEKRQALTSLMSYKPGRVGSGRVPSSSTAGILPSNSQQSRPNAVVPIYEDQRGAFGGEDIGPVSIISAAKHQETVKENTLKPGPWTTVSSAKKKTNSHRNTMGFTVHEDNGPSSNSYDFHKTVPRECLEDYSNYKPSIKIPDPADPRLIPMYPKNRVYIDPNTEYSIDELRSHRYINKNGNRSKLNHSNNSQHSILLESLGNPQLYTMLKTDNSLCTTLPYHTPAMTNLTNNFIPEIQPITILDSPENSPHASPKPSHSNWRCPVLEQSALYTTIEEPEKPKIPIYEQSIQEMPPQAMQPRGSAMKTPFKTLNPDELVETGSRGGMDVAATAQPADSAQPMLIFADDSFSAYDMNGPLNETNTQIFNLNAMHVSTPECKKPFGMSNIDDAQQTRKQLFVEPQNAQAPNLSVILETTERFSSSSSSGATTKSTVVGNQTKLATMATIEEHNSYLAQNLMANAALRSSLLGNLMDFNSTSPPDSSMPMMETSVRTIPKPVVATPLDYAPSNPFEQSLIRRLLERVGFPGIHHEGYVELAQAPKLCVRKDPVSIGNNRYIVDKQLGKGTYGTVFKALDLSTNQNVALKLQKPPNKWEFYICREIQTRLGSEDLRPHFMDVSIGYFSDQCSILVSEYMPCGSLLDLANNVKQKSGKSLRESLCIYFTIEMLRIVEALHNIKIIHADIKPDNFLVMLNPDDSLSLQLIDFGCSIDMSLFPPDTTFTQKINTEDFICCEVRDGRPWSYHTDLFCVAASAHVLIFEKYISLVKCGETWSLVARMQRYARKDMWNIFFEKLLNQQNGSPDCASLRLILHEELKTFSSFPAELRYVVNLLKKR